MLSCLSVLESKFSPAANLGQAARENAWQAVIGFIISDAGLTVLAVITIAKSGSLDTFKN
jgi:branched-chain amino acid:cation transporter, LIVCS family